MLSIPISTIVFLFTTFLVGTSHALPVSSDFTLVSRGVKDPCLSSIARRTAVDQAAAARDCFKELESHVFVGGKSGVLGSSSGAHLASGVLRSNPEKNGPINAQTLIMQATVTPGTKTLWVDDGLTALITQAQTAQTELADATAKVATAQKAVEDQEARIAKSQKPSNSDKTKLKNLNNALTKAKAAVTPLTATQTLMIKLNGDIADKTKLYTKAGITGMCVDAMKLSFAQNQGLLKGGDFDVTAPNLGESVKLRLLADSAKTRINSCFPVA